MKFQLSLLVLFVFTSCKSIISISENVNTKKQFESTENYLTFINDKTGISLEKIIVLDNGNFKNLLDQVINDKLTTYYGIAYENYFVKADQLKIKSCSGQIKTLYNMCVNNSSELVKSNQTDLPVIKCLQFDKSKCTLIFLYSYKLGGLSKSKINSVIKELKDNPYFDYKILSLDNYDISEKQNHF
jgi:hypothetical protein